VTYAILSTEMTGTSLHTRALQWCEAFADDWRQLGADGLAEPGVETTSPADADPADLARSIDLDSRGLGWTGTVWVLAEPEFLATTTGDPFRRTIGVALERITEDVRFPYEELEDTGQRAAWFTECLEAEEIVDSRSVRAQDIAGIDDGQRSLDSF
jgi:hypothetical protein